MKIIHAAIATAGAAGLAVTVLGAAPAQAAAPTPARSPDVCSIRVVSLKALNLQEDNQRDEIVLELADTKTVQRTYAQGQKRNTLGDGTGVFAGSTRVSLLEVDPLKSDVLAHATVRCADRTGTSTLIDPTGDAIYQATWQTRVIA